MSSSDDSEPQGGSVSVFGGMISANIIWIILAVVIIFFLIWVFIGRKR